MQVARADDGCERGWQRIDDSLENGQLGGFGCAARSGLQIGDAVNGFS